jgi:hypothetical protein
MSDLLHAPGAPYRMRAERCHNAAMNANYFIGAAGQLVQLLSS